MAGIRDILFATLMASFATPLLIASMSLATAQVMTSPNYQIQQDSINFGGGFSSSDNYLLESTAGEVATGDRSSTNFNLRGGYQQLDTNFISLSAAAAVSMAPAIAGITGGTANGSTSVTVVTDSPAGYELSIAASQSPAMQSDTDTIADYVPEGDPDFAFVTASADAHFGYSPSGSHIVDRFLDNGASCNNGSSDTALACWDGLNTADEVIARSSGANVPAGTETTVHFRVGVGASAFQTSGTYVATTTLTAISL